MQRNPFLIMALSGFLSFFGCSRKPAETITAVTHGPFTIQLIKKSYKTFNMNYGWVNTSHGEYHVLYKGKPVSFSENLQNNTGYSHLWQAYILEGAPSPTLIAGSQSLYLITENNGVIETRPLVEQGSDFASLQYLDAENGQPQRSALVFMSNGDDTVKTLRGGDYLMVSQHAVLHVPDLVLYRFNKNNDSVDNYSFQGDQGAIAFSPDRKKMVFAGSFQTWNTDKKPEYEMALIIYDFQQDTGVSLPFSRTTTRLKEQRFIDRQWLDTYFEWKRPAEGNYKLQQKTLETLPPWQGMMKDEDTVYELSPVSLQMQQVLADFLLERWGLTKEKVLPGNEYSTNQIRIVYSDLEFSLWYREEEKELLLMKNSYTDEHEDRYKALINEVGAAFNAELMTGKYQDIFVGW